MSENELRQEFGKVRAQRDALRQLRGPVDGSTEEDSWVEVPAPVELVELQTKDLAAEKEAVEKEVAELRRELGLDG